MNPSDHDLLQQHSRDGDQSAFAELVRRHLNLVYSAALRQVRSTHLAEEIAQSVFLDLARNPAGLKPGTPLVAWLHVVTRRTAIDVIRRESRRQTHERAAAAELAVCGEHVEPAMKPDSSAWSEVEPLLDEAVETLAPADRNAILLRFFENKSLREVGAALGVSEDTAQKRVSRALERLRGYYVGRGVAVGGAAFAATLSANAVQAAPASLAAAISSATAALPSVAVAAVKQLAMTTAQKTVASLAVAAALGLALYTGLPAWRLHREVQAGQTRLDALAAEAHKLSLEQAAATRELARLARNHIVAPAAPLPGTDDALTSNAAEWVARVAQLKQAIARHPELSIPELQLLDENDWLFATQSDKDYSREETVADTLRFLRTRAKYNFIERTSEAVLAYFSKAGKLPAHVDQLSPHFAPPVDPAILARYDFHLENGLLVYAEKVAGAADLDRLALGFDAFRTKGRLSYNGVETVPGRAVREAAAAYASAHAGAGATDPAQLEPFLSSPIDAKDLAELFRSQPFTTHYTQYKRAPSTSTP
jgi:RNA polymerase sigma factor (sigma-70 family)